MSRQRAMALAAGVLGAVGMLTVTLLAGPLGLGSFLVRRAWRLRRFGDLGATDLA